MFHFLSLEEVLYIHSAEISLAGHDPTILDLGLLKSSIENTYLVYEKGYVTNLFELAVHYIKSIVLNHPFLDGNKRTGLASGLVFLEYNGFMIKENQEEELADKVLAFIKKEISQEDLAKFLEDSSIPINFK